MKHYSCRRAMWIAFSFVSVFVLANPVLAAITTTPAWQSDVLGDPNPATFTWNSSIAYYNNGSSQYLIYAGDDGKIYAFDVNHQDHASSVVCNTSALATGFSSVAGFIVTADHYLYFHDNAISANIYRVLLSDQWPADYESFDTQVSSGIFGFAQNHWTDAVWFTSADFGAGNMHLYEVNASFDNATQRASFGKPHGENAGNGPIIFKGASTLLYGESVWGGDGYFHLVDSTTGDIVTQDYLIFNDGLAAAAYGYDNMIYATTGNGKKICKINGSAMEEVATTDNDAQAIVFDGISFYVSEMETGSGAVNFNSLWEDPTPVSAITTVTPYRSSALAHPSPIPFTWNSSIAYYNNQLIYAGADGKIYAYDLDTGNSMVICDTSGLATSWSSVSGFLVSSNNYLYFHENTFPTVNIYRVLLTDTWPTNFQTLDTDCDGSIFSLTQNQWTDAIWFASADLSANEMYLYEVDAGFAGTTKRASFAAPNGGGNGPIIFKGASTLLYGESVWGGDGYFHLVDSTTGDIVTQDYLIFDDGLAAAAYGYHNMIYATTGNGKKICKINGSAMEEVATTDNDAQAIVFDGISFYVSEMETGSGAVSFNALWHLIPTGVPSGQAAAEGVVDGELAVNCQSVVGNKAIGISAGDNNSFVESLESVNPNTIGDNTNRPNSFPFGLVNFRLKVTSPDGIATATVFLSEAAPVGSKWYKFDWINGWYDYSDHATLSADRKSVILEFKDSRYGDADHIVNGHIVDPGGLATFSSSSGGDADSTGGGGGGCFINTAASGSECNALHMSLAILVLGTLIGACLALRSSGGR